MTGDDEQRRGRAARKFLLLRGANADNRLGKCAVAVLHVYIHWDRADGGTVFRSTGGLAIESAQSRRAVDIGRRQLEAAGYLIRKGHMARGAVLYRIDYSAADNVLAELDSALAVMKGMQAAADESRANGGASAVASLGLGSHPEDEAAVATGAQNLRTTYAKSAQVHAQNVRTSSADSAHNTRYTYEGFLEQNPYVDSSFDDDSSEEAA